MIKCTWLPSIVNVKIQQNIRIAMVNKLRRFEEQIAKKKTSFEE